MSRPPRNSVVIQDQLSSNGQWRLFEDPVAVVQTCHLDKVMDCLERIDVYTQNGLHAAGFLSYEAAGGLDAALQSHRLKELPLIWFGIYKKAQLITLPDPGESSFYLGEWKSSTSIDEYNRSIGEIKRHIENGDTYQVNYTLRLKNSFSGDPWKFFLTLMDAQHSGYCAYIHFGHHHICSLSPELFFSLSDGKMTCRPMKGTAKRGGDALEDQERERWLFSSKKNRAENVMIVDMIRNDLGRIAKTGSVRVDRLFSIEKYSTLFQMTSTVTADIYLPFSTIFKNMFPCASITGAPKIKTMEIIKNIESDPRGIYTGSIGYIAPDRKAQFNVAIRTVTIDVQSGRAEYGVGGGIVWDSEASQEYEECWAKAAILYQKHPAFELIETLLWTSHKGFNLLDFHFERLSSSARYFQFEFSPEDWSRQIDAFNARHHADAKRVRITLSPSGKLSLEASPVISLRGSKVALASEASLQHSQFVFHKTSRREFYTGQLDRHPEMADIILWNQDGMITESCVANVVVLQGKTLYTPPLSDGLLPGVFRKHLLEHGIIKEKCISVDECLRSSNVFLINSLRGWISLDKANADNVWIVRDDLRFQTPASSF
jgi:para-aminobenzoate synthetase/4-amino-4-deoxychorismate lyase